MVQDLSHIKVTRPADQPNKGLGSPWARGTDPKDMASYLKLGKPTAAGEAVEVAEQEVNTDAGPDAPH